jgi:hypothetical protein
LNAQVSLRDTTDIANRLNVTPYMGLLGLGLHGSNIWVFANKDNASV